MEKINLSIIIVNFNTLDLVVDCIKSIKKYTKDIKFEIIVINNHPQSNDYKKLKKLYQREDEIKILKSPNHGFGAANNIGAKKARGEFLLFLNSDTLIIDDSLQKLIHILNNNPKMGAISPLLYNPDGKLQKYAFGDFQSLLSVTWRKRKKLNPNRNKKITYINLISGAAMMIRKATFERVGGFDERFFMYFEDDDLCRRLVNLGKKNAIITSTKIIHLQGKSSSMSSRKIMYYQSQNYYWRKHKGLFLEMVMRTFRFPYLIWQKQKNKNV